MEKKENASKLISSLVALSLATTLGVPTIALADQGQDATPEPAARGSKPRRARRKMALRRSGRARLRPHSKAKMRAICLLLTRMA